MSLAPLTTYADVIQHVLDFLGAQPTGEAQRDARRATLAALRALTGGGMWSYYFTRGRLYTQTPYQEGQITYDAPTRTVTLVGGVWPDWTLYGALMWGNRVYSDVHSVPTPTTLVLATTDAPPTSVTTATAYTLFRNLYPLPADCLAVDRLMLEQLAWEMFYEHPSPWLQRQRLWRGPATPRIYTILGAPKLQSALAVGMYPVPDAVYPIDFIYRRRPRAVLLDGYSTGYASVVTSSTTITGSGTTWTSSMIGSCVRLSGDSVTPPTGPVGPNNAALEAVILAVPDATSLVTDTPSPVNLGNVSYLISDVVDVEPGAMLNALYRAAEWQIALSRSRKDAGTLFGNYRQALLEAREADARNAALETSGRRPVWPVGLRYFPSGPDIS